ncbi:MAG: 5-oxoprolinase subunit PxpB [Desulfobacteraceae bacterium]|nr:5-oxoprolinase subunit PxpB [Desulfobacteraceae bacterium]
MDQTELFNKAAYRIAGDHGLLVEFGDGIDPAINAKVRAMAKSLEQDMPEGLTETIPTYRSLLLIYDPELTSPEKLKFSLKKIANHLDDIQIAPPRVVEIPVCYGGEFGPDIETVAKTNSLEIEEVIQLHTDREYLIYMVGFTPGFAFLGGLDERLYTPRLENPRVLVSEGSVGIANNQTGMYSIESPGGWQLIGRTPLKLFAPERKFPFLYKAGDKIKFTPVSKKEFHDIAKKEKD